MNAALDNRVQIGYCVSNCKRANGIQYEENHLPQVYRPVGVLYKPCDLPMYLVPGMEWAG